jgi:hypothetical protein
MFARIFQFVPKMVKKEEFEQKSLRTKCCPFKKEDQLGLRRTLRALRASIRWVSDQGPSPRPEQAACPLFLCAPASSNTAEEGATGQVKDSSPPYPFGAVLW